MLIATWAPEFLARHPGVKLELNVTDRNVDVIREGYDLAVRMGPLRDTELISRKLADLHWILVASPAYLERHGRPETVEDLRSHSCLRYLTSGRPWPFAFADGYVPLPARLPATTSALAPNELTSSARAATSEKCQRRKR